MLDARYLSKDKWSDWEPCRLRWALDIASIYGNRNADEFVFEDLPRFNPIYYTGCKLYDAVQFKMTTCPCRHVEGWFQYKWKSLKWKFEYWQYEIRLRARVRIREYCGIVENV